MRYVPPGLQAHLDTGTTTLCLLVKVTPKLPGIDPFGMTTLDRDVTYDDGNGEITYLAAIGAEPSTITSQSSMDIDNAEVKSLMPAYDIPVTEEQILSGALDYAEFTAYQVNYEDLTMGAVTLMRGYLGKNHLTDSGLSWTSEFTGLNKRLKQTIVQLDSIQCRATFGSQSLGTEGADVTERFPCGFDASTLWVEGTVTAVGTELRTSFTASGLTADAATYQPGMIHWTSGANAGIHSEVESHAAGGVITLPFETYYDIAVGDTFQIRPDCTHYWKNTDSSLPDNSCQGHWGADWVNHYRGEPWIPVADGATIFVPGASTGSGAGGTVTIQQD